MNLRQRWCGFRGHRSVLMYSMHKAGDIAEGCTVSVALACKRCRYRTKWFGFSPLDGNQLTENEMIFEKWWSDQVRACKQPDDYAYTCVAKELIEWACRAWCADQGWDADAPVTYAGTRKQVCNRNGSVVKQWEMHIPEATVMLQATVLHAQQEKNSNG